MEEQHPAEKTPEEQPQTSKQHLLDLVAINKNLQIKNLQTFGDKLSDFVTAVAGSNIFLLLNVIWFVGWILINTAHFGKGLVFDAYPFGLLTTAVSLEAIVLSVFVLISQNRQSERSELRAELDYITDLQSDAEVDAIFGILERIAAKQNIDITDLLHELKTNQRRILREHPATKDSVPE